MTFIHNPMHEEMLTYGLRKGTERDLVFIEDAEKGLKCGCVCPCCNQPLEARKGNVRKPHFSHAPGYEDCKGGRMTALHLLAQKVLERDKVLLLPPMPEDSDESLKRVTFDEIQLESPFKHENRYIRSDSLGTIYDKSGKTHELQIEIYVTNKLNKSKKDFIRKNEKPCIEIDFSDLLGTEYTEDDVIKRLTEDVGHKEWIFWKKKKRQIEKPEQRPDDTIVPIEPIPSYSRFILYANGEAVIRPIEGDFNEKKTNIIPEDDSIYEVVINAKSDYDTYHLCYFTACVEAYKCKDCRICKKRKFETLDFEKRNLRIFCDPSRYYESRFLPPKFAVKCWEYEYDQDEMYRLKGLQRDRNIKIIRIK